MSKVEELLAKYNPNGIDDIPLWELTAWDKRFNAVDKSMQKKVVKYKYYLAKDLDELVDDIGDIRILYTNERVAYTSEEKCKDNVCEGEIVAIPWGGTPTVKYYKGKFVTGDNRIATSLDTNRLNNKYLYYWMISQLGIISDYYRGAGIQHPSMLSVLSMQIPLPHIKVQEEIVKILDSFTNLIDALNEELSLRQKQFEYYREKLLTFDDEEPIIMNDIIHDLRTGLNPRTHFKLNTEDANCYYVTVRELGLFDIVIDEKTDKVNRIAIDRINERSKIKNNDILFSGTGTIGRTALVKSEIYKWNIKEGVYVITPNILKVNPRYLIYLLHSLSLQKQYEIKAEGGAVKSVSMKEFKSLIVYIPPLSIQQSIVEKLDAFESLISSLKEEIALRQKQYEYYREKLLTFE